MTQNPTQLGHVERLTGDDPRALAKHAIRLLEQRIYQEFGLKLRLGAELEFSLIEDKVPPNNYMRSAFLYRTDHLDIKYADRYQPADASTPWQHAKTSRNKGYGVYSDIMFPNSPSIAFTYREIHSHKYEAVISHLARHDSLPADGSRCLTFAREIEGLQNTILNSRRFRGKFAQDEAHDRQLRSITRRYTPRLDAHLNPPQKKIKPRTHGLHINVSFCNDDGLLPKDFYQSKIPFEAGIGTLTCEGAYLLISEPSAIQRLKDRTALNHYLHLSVRNRDLRDRPPYIEVKYPAASSDPYYATLLVLSGCYEMLSKGGYNRCTHRLDAEEALTAKKKEYTNTDMAGYTERFFNQERRFLTLLDTLEPGLGERFEAALNNHPPYQEKSGEKRVL